MGITKWLYLYIIVIALEGCDSSRPNLVEQGIMNNILSIHLSKGSVMSSLGWLCSIAILHISKICQPPETIE